MAVIYVARSETVTEWASDVGLGKNIFKVGVGESDEAVLAELNTGICGGTDWTVVKSADAGELTDEQAVERLAKREKIIDPKFYPRLRGTMGLFRIKIENVENSALLKKALEGMQIAALKLKPVDIADYLITNAQR
ncbi:MAG TPA: hypothetical protein VGG27_07510 [Magnetospirillaceae bacterium]|jgi:hypothetical protein